MLDLKHKKRALPALAAALIAALAMNVASADEDSEREQLAAISMELARLQQQVALASKQAPAAARVRFKYEWLTRDLEQIRLGIDDHLNAPVQPRPALQLRGEYRR